jgi:hypothetical protein
MRGSQSQSSDLDYHALARTAGEYQHAMEAGDRALHLVLMALAAVGRSTGQEIFDQPSDLRRLLHSGI